MIPQFTFHLAQAAQSIEPPHPLWHACLPADRACFAASGQKPPFSAISYGDYFQAARAFLEKDDYRAVRRGLSHAMGCPVAPSALTAIDLYLVKHGQFYHPARVDVQALGKRQSLALNVAVSDAGRKIYRREFHCLQRLGEEFPVAYVPRVYDEALVLTYDKGPLGLFLEEWFDGFCEFHLGLDPITGQQRATVWSDSGNFMELSQLQTQHVIRQATMILTYYYDPETFEQIYPWHHGAGDFVARLEDQRIQVKLISVRDYTSLFRAPGQDPPRASDETELLEALFVFWLNLSLRMRLDRRDGVGEVVFYDDWIIPSMVDGFFQGLELMRELRGLPLIFPQAVKAYFQSRTQGQWDDLTRGILGRYPGQSAEAVLIERHLENHLTLLRHALQRASVPTGV